MSRPIIDPEIADLLGIDTRPNVQVGGAFDAASRLDRDLAMWQPSIRSADADLIPVRPIIEGRVRDMTNNDGYVRTGVELHKDHIVGDRFQLNSKPAWRVLGLDAQWAQEFQEEVEYKFGLIAESPENWVDAQRKLGLTPLVRLGVGVYLASGEFLSTVEWIRESIRPCKTALQLIDLDRLGNPNGQSDSRLLRGGVAKNKRGQTVGVWIRIAHPTDYGDPGSFQWKFVPMRKPWGRLQVIHLVDHMRIDQTRGVSALVAGLKALRITSKYRDVVLQNAVVQATYAATIESDLPSETVFAQMGGGSDSALRDYITNYLSSIADYAGENTNLRLDGAKIPHLFPGTKLHLQPAGTPGGVGSDFEKSLIRYLAAILGVSYEQLSTDYSETNYASHRAASNETWRRMRAKKANCADVIATAYFRLWLEEQIGEEKIDSLPRNAPVWWEGVNADAYSRCTWVGAARGQTDELKETQAAVQRIRAGLSTRETEIARLNGNYLEVFEQLAREQTLADKLGLVFAMDNTASPQEGDGRAMKAEKGSQESRRAA